MERSIGYSIDKYMNNCDLHNKLYPKRKSLLAQYYWIILIVWFASAIAMPFATGIHVKHKEHRLMLDISGQIAEVFHNHSSFVDVVYSGGKVQYERMAIPQMPKKDGINEYLQDREIWSEEYGDLFKMYRLKYKQNEWEHTWDNSNGWQLIELSLGSDYRNDCWQINAKWYFPYAVGYINQDYSWEYNYLPSIQNAVDDAFEYFTKNKKSKTIINFEEGSVDRILNSIKANEYYLLKRVEHIALSTRGVDIEGGFEKISNGPIKHTYMYNGQYKVYVGRTQYEGWMITKRYDDVVEDDLKSIRKKWAISIAIIFGTLLIVLCIASSILSRKIGESLYQRMMRLCNPSNYMKPYNKEKVDYANVLYKRLITTYPDNEKDLIEIADEASMYLGICLVDQYEKKELLKAIRPSNFMNPYDAEKVTLANTLYEELSKPNLSLKDFKKIEHRAIDCLLGDNKDY